MVRHVGTSEGALDCQKQRPQLQVAKHGELVELGQAWALGDSGLGALMPQGQAGDCPGSLRVVEFWGRDGREAK